MPGFNTHYFFGVTAYQKMEEGAVKAAIHAHPRAYSYGQQGPDFFFFFPPNYLGRKKPGHALHTRDSGAFFSVMTQEVEKLSGEDRQIGLAYLAGFLGHYSLDRSCHPYVYATTGLDYGKHIGMETDIGTGILAICTGRKASQFHQDGTILLSFRETMVVASLLHTSLKEALGISISKSSVALALYIFLFGLACIRDPHGWKRKVAGRLEKFLIGKIVVSPQISKDLKELPRKELNLDHEPWYSPYDPKTQRTESFPELFKEAQMQYLPILQALQTYLEEPTEAHQAEYEEKVGNHSYHSGLRLEEEPFVL